MGLTGYLALFTLAVFVLAVWAVVYCVRQKRWGLAVLTGLAFVAMCAAEFWALGELISRM